MRFLLRNSSRLFVLSLLWTITLAAVSPNHGKEGDRVTIMGAGFQENAQVVFGGRKCVPTAKSATSITCTVPRGMGTVEVRIVTPEDHSAVLKNGFTYDK